MCTLPVIYERNGLQLALSVEVFAYSLHSGLKHIFSNSCDVDYRRAISWSVHVGWEGLICLMDRSGLLLPFGCTHYHIIFWTRDSLPLVSICNLYLWLKFHFVALSYCLFDQRFIVVTSGDGVLFSSWCTLERREGEMLVILAGLGQC